MVFFTDLDEYGSAQAVYDRVNFPVLWVAFGFENLAQSTASDSARKKPLPPGGVGEIVFYDSGRNFET